MGKNTISGLLSNPKFIGTTSHTTSNYKAYFELDNHSRNAIDDKIVNLIRSDKKLNQILLGYSVKIQTITLVKSEPHEIHVDDLMFSRRNLKFINKTQSEIDEELAKRQKQICQAKDICFFSDKHYNFFKNYTNAYDWPSIHYYNIFKVALNNQLPKLFKNSFGFYLDPREKISWVLKLLNFEPKDSKKPIRICLLGDKTVSKDLSFFNFCFTIVDECESAKSAYKNYTLAIYDMPRDDYASLKEAFEPIVEICREFKEIELNKNKYSIEWHLSGDYMFINDERGHQSCSSSYPCYKCTCSKKDFCVETSANRKTKLRTLDDARIKCVSTEKQGHRSVPIFDFIDYENVHHDPLHERIRIPNKLLRLVFNELIKVDNKNSTNLDSLPAQKKLIDWLSKNIRKQPYQTKGQNSKATDPNFSLKDFSGDDCKKICMLATKEAFSSLKNGHKIAKLLNDYWRIHMGYTKNFYIDKTDLLRLRIQKWKEDFQTIFNGKDFTVYMHNLDFHVPDEIDKHGNLDIFNLQG